MNCCFIDAILKLLGIIYDLLNIISIPTQRKYQNIQLLIHSNKDFCCLEKQMSHASDYVCMHVCMSKLSECS